jgi:hypothetical protein
VDGFTLDSEWIVGYSETAPAPMRTTTPEKPPISPDIGPRGRAVVLAFSAAGWLVI